MRQNSAPARWALCGAALVAFSIYPPSRSWAVGTTKVIAGNVTDGPFALNMSRDNFLAVPYHLNDQYGLFTYSNTGGMVNPGLPAGLRAYTAQISQWGLAVETDHNGFTPTDIYAAPRGQQLQLLQSGQGYSDLTNPDLNDQGVISFLGRVSGTHGPDLVFHSVPSSPPYAQLLPPSAREEYITSKLDGSGRVYTLAIEKSTTPISFSIEAYDDANGWVNRTAGISGVSPPGAPNEAVSVNPAGQFTFPAMYDNNTKHGIYLATPSGFKFLFDRTSVQGPGSPIEATVSISDRGDVLAIIGQTSNVPLDKRTLFYTYDGRFIDLNSILPSGKDTNSFKVASLSYDGHLLVETRDLLSGRWEYYSYDGTTTSLLLDMSTRALAPRLGNDGLIYFYQQSGSRYSLLQTVPEPASLLSLTAGVLVGALRRRNSR